MPSLLDIRLDRVGGRRTAAAAEEGSAARRPRHIWRAEAAMGTIICRHWCAPAFDAAQASRLCLAGEAAAALVALSDTPELQRADDDSAAAAGAQDCAREDALSPIILALARGFADTPAPDFTKASFAELYAWSLAPPPVE
jgi:hypothetical protein